MKTEAIEDYLKHIYLCGQTEEKVGLTRLAERLKIKPASVSGMIKRLEKMNLVNNARAEGITLTPAGRKIALEVIRHHRLIELFLVEALGVPWNKVHQQAEKWEHMLSEEIEDHMDEFLGFPTHDPHGDPIPARDGSIPETSNIPLQALKAGDQGIIERISNQNPEVLAYIGKIGLYPKSTFSVIETGPLDDLMIIESNGERFTIGREISQKIFVSHKN